MSNPNVTVVQGVATPRSPWPNGAGPELQAESLKLVAYQFMAAVLVLVV